MNIDVNTDLELLLRERAEHEGRQLTEVAEGLLYQALEMERLRDAEVEAGIHPVIDDFQAGRSRPFSEFAEEQRPKYNLPTD